MTDVRKPSALIPDFLTSFLEACATRKIGGQITGSVFQHAPILFPFDCVSETEPLPVFHHPRSSCPFPTLFAPKKPERTPMELADNDPQFLTDLLAATRRCVRGHHLTMEGTTRLSMAVRHRMFSISTYT